MKPKSKIRKIIQTSVLALLATGAIYGNSALWAQTPVSLDTFIKESVANHPLIKSSHANYLQTVYAAKKSDGIYDWNLFLNYAYTRGFRSQGSTIFNSGTNIHSVSSTLSGVLPGTGSRIEFSSAYNGTEKLPTFIPGFQLTVFELGLDVTVKQPLLRNSFGYLDRIPVKIARQTEKLAQIKYREDVEDFIVAITNNYLDWLEAKIRLDIATLQKSKALETVKLVRRQVRSGTAEDLDLVQAQQNLKAKAIQVLQQASIYDNLTNQIGTLMAGKTTYTKIDYTPKETTLALSIPDKDTAIDYLKTGSNIEQLFSLNENILSYAVKGNTQQLLPNLDVFAKAAISSAETTKTDTFSNFGNKTPVTVGVEFSKPIIDTTAKNEAKRSKGELEFITEQNNDARNQLVVSLANAYDQLDYLSKMIAESKKMVGLAAKSAQLELKKYRQGRNSSFRFVLLAQDAHLSAKLNLEALKIQENRVKNQISGLLDHYQDQIVQP